MKKASTSSKSEASSDIENPGSCLGPVQKFQPQFSRWFPHK